MSVTNLLQQTGQPDFDKEAVYDAKISPLVQQIIKICKSEGIPMVMDFTFACGKNPKSPADHESVTSSTDHNGWRPEHHKQAIRILMA